MGGVINVDSPGGISGAGSVFDQNDEGQLSSDQLFAASTVSTPDSMGRVTFTLNPAAPTSNVSELGLAGYIIDADHIRLVESDSNTWVVVGTALGQNGKNGTYSMSSLSGSTGVFGAVGANPISYSGSTAGLLTFNADGSISGNVSHNDSYGQSPPGGSTLIPGGTYTIDASGTGNDGGTGRVTIANVTDGTFIYNYQLYLAHTGAVLISMDATEAFYGLFYLQNGTGTFTAGSFSGTYALNISQNQNKNSGPPPKNDGLGTVTADGTSAFTGFLDRNFDLIPTAGTAGGVTGTFTSSANGVFPGTIFGISTFGKASDNFTFYLLGASSGASVGAIGIENDTDQQTLATFVLLQ